MANDNQQANITITASLANAILKHMTSGGTRLEADMLAEHLINQSNAQQAEAQRLTDIDAAQKAAVEAYKASVAKDIYDAELAARGSVVVTQEEFNDTNGVDRPGAFIAPHKKSKGAVS